MTLQNQLDNIVSDVLKSVIDDSEKIKEYTPRVTTFFVNYKHICKIRDFIFMEFPDYFDNKNKVFRTLSTKRREMDDSYDKIVEMLLNKFLPDIAVFVQNEEMLEDPLGYYDYKLGEDDDDGGVLRKMDLALNLDKLGYILDLI